AVRVRRSALRRRRRQWPGYVAERWFPPTRRPRRRPLRRPPVRTASSSRAAPRLAPVCRSTHLAVARVLHPGGKRPAPHVAHTAWRSDALSATPPVPEPPLGLQPATQAGSVDLVLTHALTPAALSALPETHFTGLRKT